MCVSRRRRSSRPARRAPPPARTIPRSMMSAASSGGVLSSVDLIASMIWLTDSSIARRISSDVSTTVFGRPLRRSRPRTSACTSSASSHAEPISGFSSSAVWLPIRSLYSFLMWLMIASSISSPPTRMDCETTIPPSEMTATSVVPPPTSTIMFPVGSATGSPAPIAAAMGSSIRYALPAPAAYVASSTARFSTPVTPEGTQTTTRGCANRCWCTFWMKWRSICSVTSKSAITPSLSGRIAWIVPGVRPSIRLASIPTAWTSVLRESIATTDGSDSTIPRPRTYTRVLAVPRSTAMSRPPMPVRYEKKPIRCSGVRISAGAAARTSDASLRTSAGAAPAGSLATAEQLGVESQERCDRQADDVPVVALDRLHEGRALALDRVAAGPFAPFPRGEIPVDVVRLEQAEADACDRHVRAVTPLVAQCDPAHHLVGAAREPAQERLRLGRLPRLAKGPPVEDDGGVNPQNPCPGHGCRLAPRVLDHQAARLAFRQLLHVGRSDAEVDPELLQSRPALGRAGSEDERLGQLSGELGEEQPGLAPGRLGRVGAVDEVRLDLQPEVAADRARGRLERVGGADHLARRGHGLVALEHERHQRAAGNEVDEVSEERLLAVLGVVLLGQLAIDAHVLHGDDREPLALEPADDLAGQAALERVRLHQDQGPVH